MGFLKKLSYNAGSILKGESNIFSNKGILTNANPNDAIAYGGVTVSEEQLEGRQAIYPQWFFSAALGQPREVDTKKIREFAKSAWVQMVENTFKKAIYSLDYEFVPIDEEDGVNYSEKIKRAEEFFAKINVNGDTVNDIDSEVITDIAEVDSGVYNYVYTAESYDIGDVPVWDAWGRVIGHEKGLILKDFGKRELVQIKSADGATFLKQIDIHKNLKRYYQYSFKHPRQNPTPFSADEISYLMMNRRSYSVYGFSPVQSIQQVLEILIQGTRYNKDLYKNNAIPDMIASLPKLSSENLAKLKRLWNNEYKGKPHQLGFINWPIENLHKLADSNRDLEWLDGQKWYFKIVFGVFGVSPTEAGFFENANKSNDEGQERITVRNALRPYLKAIEQNHTNKTLRELFQEENPGIKFQYKLKDDAQEKIEFEQNMRLLENGSMTINEYRNMIGKDKVEWGDEPLRRPMDPTTFSFGSPINNQTGDKRNVANPDDEKKPKGRPKKEDEEEKSYKKSFERFLDGR